MFENIKNIIKGTKFENNVYLVGGYVRDCLMNITPKDYDIVVSLPNGGIELANYIFENTWFGNTKCTKPVIYPTYGTAMIKLDGIDLELVQTRKEQYHSDSRNPECVFGTLEEDAFRRDLTINSLYKNISTNEILDPTGKGLHDIKNKIIRTTSSPDIIFSDDPLRMLRVIRFASRYQWGIDNDTYTGIVKNVYRIEIITHERIRDEINKLLLCPIPSLGFSHLLYSGLLKEIIPSLAGLKGMKQNKYHCDDVWGHTMSVLDKTKPFLENRLAALLHDIGKYYAYSYTDTGVHFYQHENIGTEKAKLIMQCLKYPNDIINKVTKVVKNHMITKFWGKDFYNFCKKIDYNVRKLQYEMGDDLELLLDIIDADNKSHSIEHCLPLQVHHIKLKLGYITLAGLGCRKIKLPVDGYDIMGYLDIEEGVHDGKMVGKIKDHLINMYLKNPKKYKDKDECRKEIKAIYKNFKKQML
jgi:tRNA nucleotidyltransferase/poly(A) polymerase